MINLLPQEQQKILQKEYKLRRLAVALGFLVALFAIATILLLPSYILVAYRVSSGTNMTPDQDEQTERSALAAEVATDNTILTALTPAQSTPASASIARIMADAPAGDTVTALDYEPSTAGAYSITVGGVAESRESLRAFADALEREPTIASVDLPISNFASDSNISFSFVVTGKNI